MAVRIINHAQLFLYEKKAAVENSSLRVLKNRKSGTSRTPTVSDI